MCAGGKKGPEDGCAAVSDFPAAPADDVEGEGEGRCGSAGECSMVRTITSQNCSHRRRLSLFLWWWWRLVGAGAGGSWLASAAAANMEATPM